MKSHCTNSILPILSEKKGYLVTLVLDSRNSQAKIDFHFVNYHYWNVDWRTHKITKLQDIQTIFRKTTNKLHLSFYSGEVNKKDNKIS